MSVNHLPLSERYRFEEMPVYSENRMEQIKSSCVQTVEILYMKAGGTHSYHCAL
jgi:hypothetical protein